MVKDISVSNGKKFNSLKLKSKQYTKPYVQVLVLKIIT